MHSAPKKAPPSSSTSPAEFTSPSTAAGGSLPIQRQHALARTLHRFTARPAAVQRRVAAPVLTAAALHTSEVDRIQKARETLQRSMADLSVVPASPADHALQRQANQASPDSFLPPQTPRDWVAVMRQQAEQAQGRRMDAKSHRAFTALQRQVTAHLSAAYRQDRQLAPARTTEYARHLAALQRHPISEPVARAVLAQVPPGERMSLQRAVDQLHSQEAVQRQQEEQALQRHALQRQLAELDEQATMPVMERIQARRGSGNPLPAAVLHHLEQGLNHDLSRVRIHDDAEADKLAKSVNAVAFTAGSDIYFQSGKFNPNTQTGLELLAHEVTHTVQQAQGRVGTGIDPDAGLEAEARATGKRLAGPFQAVPASPMPHPGSARRQVSLQRLAGPAGGPLKTVADSITPPKAGINKVGFIKNTEGANLRSGPAELPGSRELTTAPLPPGTRVFVSGTHPQKPEWHYVTATLASQMVRGYVQGFRITTNLPEPSATLYFVKKNNETLRPLASSIYRQDVQPGRDYRFYEETVLYLTQQAGLGGAKKDGSVKLIKDRFVWLPSPAFANTLAGKVPSGSITGGAVTQARTVSRRLDDVLASISQSPQHLGKVGRQYKDAILANLPQIIGVTAAFMAAEGLSILLAATPTGVGQLAAAVIQVGLGAWAAYGAAEALDAAMPYAQKWLMTAWKANGDSKLIAVASENFVFMVVQIALAALALLGARGNMAKGMKLAENVKITPPGLGTAMAVTPSGQGVAIPVFKPGSITATGTAVIRPGTGSIGPASSQVKLSEQPSTPQSELEKALANRKLSDEQLEALLKKTKNWEEVKNYIGMKADKSSTPPPGYEWYTANGKTLIRRKSGNKASGEYAPLTVQDGMVVLNAGGSNRISVYSRYRANFIAAQVQAGFSRAATERLLNMKTPSGKPLYQLHHLIPDNVAQGHALVKEALRRVKGYTIDRGSNMYAMPRKQVPGDPYGHLGSHPNYDRWVSDRLNRALVELTDEGAIPLEKVKAADIDATLKKVEMDIGRDIKNKNLPGDVLKELEGGGMKISQAAPGKADEEGVA